MVRDGRAARGLTGLRALFAALATLPLAAAAQQDAKPAPAERRFDSNPAGDVSRLLFTDDSEPFASALARTRWRGDFGLEQRWMRSDESGKRDQTLEFASVDMATYLWQPWIAQLRANAGFVASQNRGGAGADQGSFIESGRALSFTGGADVTVFPSSRFPFTASFQANDSRASGEATPSDYTSLLMSMRQAYRSPLGDQVYNGSLERSVLNSQSFGRDTVTALTGTAQRTFASHALDLAASYAQNRRALTDDGSNVTRFSAHHGYRPTDTASLDSFASFSATDLFTRGGGSADTRFMQLNSLGTWRPDEDSPLFVTGGMRFADATFGTGADTSARTLAGNVAASYALTPAVNLVAATGVTRLQAGSATDVVTVASLGGNYSPAPVSFAGFSYSFGGSGAASNQAGGEEARHHALGAQANHQLSRAVALGGAASLIANVAQGASILGESGHDPTRTLVHSAGLSLHVQPGAGSDAFVALTGGDSRSRGGRNERFQLANLQVSGQLQIGRRSAMTANLTVQAVRQQLDPTDKRSTSTSVQRSGVVSYQQDRPFGVRQLRYVASATFNDLQLESRLAGDAAAPHDQYTRVIEQRLDYRIGRLDFRIGMRIATLDGRNDRQAFIRIDRQFGSY